MNSFPRNGPREVLMGKTTRPKDMDAGSVKCPLRAMFVFIVRYAPLLRIR
jgi:hypothetical protein